MGSWDRLLAQIQLGCVCEQRSCMICGFFLWKNRYGQVGGEKDRVGFERRLIDECVSISPPLSICDARAKFSESVCYHHATKDAMQAAGAVQAVAASNHGATLTENAASSSATAAPSRPTSTGSRHSQADIQMRTTPPSTPRDSKEVRLRSAVGRSPPPPPPRPSNSWGTTVAPKGKPVILKAWAKTRAATEREQF